MSLPAGTVSFLLTDIEGSTQKWQLALTGAFARRSKVRATASLPRSAGRPTP